VEAHCVDLSVMFHSSNLNLFLETPKEDTAISAG